MDTSNNNSIDFTQPVQPTQPFMPTEQKKIEVVVDPFLTKSLSFMGTVQNVFGVITIIIGAISCIGIISAVIGVPMIIMGVKLFKAGSAFSKTSYSNDGQNLYEALTRLANYFKWCLIMLALTIVYYILLVFVIIGIAASSSYY